MASYNKTSRFILLVLIFMSSTFSLQSAQIHRPDESYVLLNNRKFYVGETFSLLTDCGYYRFTLTEINPTFLYIKVLYPRSIIGNDPADLSAFGRLESKDDYEGMMTVGEVCYTMSTCTDQNRKICFKLKKSQNYFELSYNQKKASLISPSRRAPTISSQLAEGDMRQNTISTAIEKNSIMKKGTVSSQHERLRQLDDDAQKKSDAYSPHEWFVF